MPNWFDGATITNHTVFSCMPDAFALPKNCLVWSVTRWERWWTVKLNAVRGFVGCSISSSTAHPVSLWLLNDVFGWIWASSSPGLCTYGLVEGMAIHGPVVDVHSLVDELDPTTMMNVAQENYERLNVQDNTSFSSRNVDRRGRTCHPVGLSAPSGAHLQPWTWVAIRSTDLQAKLQPLRRKSRKPTRAYASVVSADRWAPMRQAPPHRCSVDRCLVQAEKAPAKKRRWDNYYATESCGIAAGMFIQAVHTMGLVTLTRLPHGVLRELLGRPGHEEAMLVMPVGYLLMKQKFLTFIENRWTKWCVLRRLARISRGVDMRGEPRLARSRPAVKGAGMRSQSVTFAGSNPASCTLRISQQRKAG